MTISQVIYVLEVAACRSISLAAQRLYISQSAVSQQILKLEKELGYPLFTRTLYGLELTAAGERFCEEGRLAVDAWHSFCQEIQGDKGAGKKHIRIGMGARVYSNGLFPEILSFFDARREWEISFITEANSDFLGDLRDKKIDLALDVLPSEDHLEAHPEFYSCSLIREKQCVLMAHSDPRAGAAGISFQELHGSTMMSGLENSSEARHLRETCRKNGITLERVYRSDGINTVMSIVRAGKGVALGPASFADYYQVAAVPLLPESEASLHFFCLKSAVRRKIIGEFRDYLKEITEALSQRRMHRGESTEIHPQTRGK